MKSVKYVLPALLLFFSATCFGATLQPYTASYTVVTHGINAGVANFHLDKLSKNRWRFASNSHTTGFVSMFFPDSIKESSTFTVDKNGLFSAHKFHYLHKGGDDSSQSILFDWQNNVAHSSYKGDKKTIAIPDGASDPFLAQLKLSRRVADGMNTGHFAVLNKNDLDIYKLKVTGSVGVSVPGGKFTATRVEKTKKNSTHKTVFWLAPKLNYVPVKVVQLHNGDPVFKLKLRSIQFAAQGKTKTKSLLSRN